MLQRRRHSLNGILILYLCAFTYLVSIMKCVTGALRGCCEWAHDKFTEREVKLISSGRSGGSGTSALSQIGKSQKPEINTKVKQNNDSFLYGSMCLHPFSSTASGNSHSQRPRKLYAAVLSNISVWYVRLPISCQDLKFMRTELTLKPV
uniref:Uncharacterized protein n=1 Tax=Glossina palpalis gambiensis TaxID=67801 RepID=A0A1B0B3D4_9MUSC